GDRILRLYGHLIIREWLSREIVDQRHWLSGLRIAKAGEIAVALRIAWDRGALRDSLPVAESFVVSKNEVLVLTKGSTHRSAKLILLQRLHRGSQKVASVQAIIAEKLVKTAVKIIASGTCHYRRGSSAGAAVLGG